MDSPELKLQWHLQEILSGDSKSCHGVSESHEAQVNELKNAFRFRRKVGTS